jgi:hypothetical protein
MRKEMEKRNREKKWRKKMDMRKSIKMKCVLDKKKGFKPFEVHSPIILGCIAYSFRCSCHFM